MKIAGISHSAVSSIHHGHLNYWLGSTEAGQLGRLDPAAATDWLAGRVALKQAFLDGIVTEPIAPNALTVRNTLSGVPYVANRPECACSISHSAGWGLAGVSQRPIGVDIERIRTRSGALIRYVSSDEERKRIAHSEHHDTLLTKIWTVKEAAMKAWRLGLEIHPKSVVLSREATDMFRAHCVTRPLLPAMNVIVCEVADFVLAIASAEAVDEKRTIHWLDVPGVSAAGHTILAR